MPREIVENPGAYQFNSLTGRHFLFLFFKRATLLQRKYLEEKKLCKIVTLQFIIFYLLYYDNVTGSNLQFLITQMF